MFRPFKSGKRLLSRKIEIKKPISFFCKMTDKLSLGAIDIETNEYTSPFKASKNKQYKCIECSKRVILRQGNVRVHHFAHYTQTNTCSYYDHPNEAQIHKDAKLLLQKLMNEKCLLQFRWECDQCGGFYAFDIGPSFTYKEGDSAVLEYRDKEGKWVADVALVNNGDVRCIIEVKNTHATVTSRPEPWYEVDARELILNINEYYNDKDLEDSIKRKKFIFDIPCIRKDITRRCYGSFCYKEPWVRRIPGHSTTNEDNSCILCNKQEYEPTCDGWTGKFQNCQIRVCYECLCKDIFQRKIREKYASDKPRGTEIVWAKKGTIDIKREVETYTKAEKEILKKVPTLPTRFGQDAWWKQTIACIECGRFQYNPIYYDKNYHALCKICLGNENVEETIKQKIEKNIKPKSICMIDD